MAMNLIGRNSDYAIRALCYMAQQKQGTISASELGDRTNIPRPYLRRILQQLAQHGILNSYRGEGGGFELARDPELISLADILEVFQGGVHFSQCILQTRICENTQCCKLRRRLEQIEDNTVKELSATSIASLV